MENPNGDFKYPLISHTRGFEYDDDGFHIILSDEQRDEGYTPDSDDQTRPFRPKAFYENRAYI